MTAGPSLNSHTAVVQRRTTGVDVEGSPLSTYVDVCTFTGGFGNVATGKEVVVGFDGQRLDAAISTLSTPDVQVDDKVTVAGRDWTVIGVKSTAVTTRVLLAAWGSR